MVPPGMGFVFFNDKAADVRARMPRVSCYWDWAPRAFAEEYWQQFCGTAPTHHIYGLREALTIAVDRGDLVDVVLTRHPAADMRPGHARRQDQRHQEQHDPHHGVGVFQAYPAQVDE